VNRAVPARARQTLVHDQIASVDGPGRLQALKEGLNVSADADGRPLPGLTGLPIVLSSIPADTFRHSLVLLSCTRRPRAGQIHLATGCPER
jgi:hypothetical protein